MLDVSSHFVKPRSMHSWTVETESHESVNVKSSAYLLVREDGRTCVTAFTPGVSLIETGLPPRFDTSPGELPENAMLCKYVMSLVLVARAPAFGK